MRTLFSMLLLLHGFAFADLDARAATAPLYSRATPSPDGIGKLYMGREIAKVMTYHGAEWLERVERLEEERPDRVLRALEIKEGMAVADIGAGTGYYSRRIAGLVGGRGIVYAVDIQPEMLEILERENTKLNLSNVKPVLATSADLGLQPASLDLAVMVDVYHELEYPHETLAQIVRALKPGGRVVFVEFRGDDPRVPIKRLHTMTEQQVRKEAAVHAIEWVRTVRDLPWQHVIVFRKR
jgi:ubiquinone/menaquinone biosynthesis C-methylase UbiE